MFAHHHFDQRRIVRLLILVWTLLFLLVLLPIRARGQETLEPPMSAEVIDEASALPPAVQNGVAAEMFLLWSATIIFLAWKGRSRLQAPESRSPRH